MDQSYLTKLLAEQTIINSKLFLVIAGGIVGFLSAVLKDYLLEGKKEKIKQKNLKRQKLEDAFVLATELFTKSIIPIQYREVPKHSAQLSMIIRFYFPTVEKDLHSFIKAYQEIEKFHMENIISKSIEPPKNIDAFAKEYRKFINKLVEESKKLI